MRDSVVCLTRDAFITRPIQQHQETVAVFGRFLVALLGHHGALFAVLHRTHKDIADTLAVGIHVFQKKHPIRLFRFAESTGGGMRHIVATIQRALEFIRLGQGPGRQHQAHEGDQQRDRDGVTQYRACPAHQTNTG